MDDKLVIKIIQKEKNITEDMENQIIDVLISIMGEESNSLSN